VTELFKNFLHLFLGIATEGQFSSKELII